MSEEPEGEDRKTKTIPIHTYRSLGCGHKFHKECRLACPYCGVVCDCLCHDGDRDRITVTRMSGWEEGDDADSPAIFIGDLIPSDATADDFFWRRFL